MGASADPTALRAARERAGLTQHQRSRLVGVAGGERVSRWELGTCEPRPEILTRLAKVLDVAAFDLLDVAEGADMRALRFAVGLSPREVAAAAHLSVRPAFDGRVAEGRRCPTRPRSLPSRRPSTSVGKRCSRRSIRQPRDQNSPGLSLHRVLRTLKPLRSATAEINGVVTTLRPALSTEEALLHALKAATAS